MNDDVNLYQYAFNDPNNFLDPSGSEVGTAFRVVNNATAGYEIVPPKRSGPMSTGEKMIVGGLMAVGALMTAPIAIEAGLAMLANPATTTTAITTVAEAGADEALVGASLVAGAAGAARNVASTVTSGTDTTAQGARLLSRQLASEEGVAELMGGGGKAWAGAGTTEPIKDINRLVSQYGGKAGDWAKVTSTAREHLETHAYRNIATGEVVELKSIPR